MSSTQQIVQTNSQIFEVMLPYIVVSEDDMQETRQCTVPENIKMILITNDSAKMEGHRSDQLGARVSKGSKW